MDVNELIRLLNTDHYSPAILEEVNDLCRNYPMFNLAHMLKVRIRTALGHSTEQELKMAAIYAADRSRLMDLVRELAPTMVEEEEAEKAEKEVEGIEGLEGRLIPTNLIIQEYSDCLVKVIP